MVALTSFAEEERVHAAIEAGASGYLLKDSDVGDVAAAVRAAHRGELQLDPTVTRGLVASLRDGEHRDPASELTSRELEVLHLVAAGKPDKQIAAEAPDQRADHEDTRVADPPQAAAELSHPGRAVGDSRGARGGGAGTALAVPAARRGPRLLGLELRVGEHALRLQLAQLLQLLHRLGPAAAGAACGAGAGAGGGWSGYP